MTKEHELRKAAASSDAPSKVVGLGHFQWDFASNTAVWTNGMFEIFDIERADFDGTLSLLFDRVHPDDRRYLAGATELARKDGQAHPVTYRIVRRDGAGGFLHGSGDTYFDDEGRPQGMLGSVQSVDKALAARIPPGILTTVLDALEKAIPFLPADSSADLATANAIHLIHTFVADQTS